MPVKHSTKQNSNVIPFPQIERSPRERATLGDDDDDERIDLNKLLIYHRNDCFVIDLVGGDDELGLSSGDKLMADRSLCVIRGDILVVEDSSGDLVTRQAEYNNQPCAAVVTHIIKTLRPPVGIKRKRGAR
jgi:hypothetical protein